MHVLKGLCVGEKRRLLVPPALAWNEGIKDYIRPDATVVFLLELVSISDQAPESAAKEL
jgi:FK506-binding protein 14